MTGDALWVQTPNKDNNNYCIIDTYIDITLEDPVDYKAYKNQIDPIQHVQSLVLTPHSAELIEFIWECKHLEN